MTKTPQSALKPPAFIGRLIEARTLAAGNVQRHLVARIDWERVPPEAEAQAEEILNTERGRAALPVVVGFEFDSRTITAREWLARLVVAELLRRRGAKTILFSAVPYQSRPRWDVYASEVSTLAMLNRLATEADALNQLVHGGLARVLWSPRLKDPRHPDSWYLLEYSRLQPTEEERRWFEESSAQAEEESAARRQLLLESAGVEALLPDLQARATKLRRLVADTWSEFVVLAP